MKKVLFIALKIFEITIAIAFCFLLIYLLPIEEFYDWTYRMLGNILYHVVWVTYMIVCLFIFIKSGAFKDWIRQNKEWVDKILK